MAEMPPGLSCGGGCPEPGFSGAGNLFNISNARKAATQVSYSAHSDDIQSRNHSGDSAHIMSPKQGKPEQDTATEPNRHLVTLYEALMVLSDR